MTDWKKAAESQGIPLTAADLETVQARLGAVETILAAFTSRLPPGTEPATIFTPGEPASDR